MNNMIIQLNNTCIYELFNNKLYTTLLDIFS